MTIEARSDDVTKAKFVKLWEWLAYLERKDKKCQRAKNEFVGTHWWGADFINPSKLGLDRTRYDPSQSAF